MPDRNFTWNPSDVVTVTNTTKENFLLELDSGQLRLDAGRSIRMTRAALDQQQVIELTKLGKLQVTKFNWRKRQDAK